MKRVLSSIGIGAATVDTILPDAEVHPGETVALDVELRGGDATQEIEGLYFALKTRVETDGDVDERVIAERAVDRAVSLAPGEERTIQVDLEIPLWTPITGAGASVWLETGVDIDWARDPTDEDQIEVVPEPFVAALFEAVADLGFELQHTELDDTPHLDDRPFAQEFDFRPTDDRYAEAFAQLEIRVAPNGDALRVVVEFVRRDEIAEEHGMDFHEQEIPMTFERANPDAIRGRLQNGLDQYA